MQPARLIMYAVASFARPVSTHLLLVLCQHIPLIPPRKKWLVERRFRLCERVVHVVEMACIFTFSSTTTNQQNKFALTINAMLAELLYGVLRLPTLLSTSSTSDGLHWTRT
jgi:hypothetical protein